MIRGVEGQGRLALDKRVNASSHGAKCEATAIVFLYMHYNSQLPSFSLFS